MTTETPSQPVRVRFAPSPTGPLHLGNARIAVANHLFKIKKKGALILRIEDTDAERFDPNSEKLIIDGLKWLGISPDEGSGLGGNFAPYRQGERNSIYKKTAESLLSEGFCFKCFCTDAELEEERKNAMANRIAPRYLGRCRDLSESEIAANRDNPFTIRFNVKKAQAGREIVINDLVHKKVAFPTDAFGDFVILRADGSAVYNFSSVVDDHLMGITHVIRGEDHLPNTPRQVLIYKALKATPPTFAHLPLLLTSSGEKLKKREGKTPNIEDLRGLGYTPDAILNYLASMGNPAFNAKEILSADDIAKKFEIERLGKGAVKVDMEKLRWINRRHIRGLGADELTEMIYTFLKSDVLDDDESSIKDFVVAIRENISLLTDSSKYVPIFFEHLPPMTDDAKEVLLQDGVRDILEAVSVAFGKMDDITTESYSDGVANAMKECGVSGKKFFMPLRAAITGMTSGPELCGVATFIGVEKVNNRIASALKI